MKAKLLAAANIQTPSVEQRTATIGGTRAPPIDQKDIALTAAEAALLLGVHVSTFWRSVAEARLPAPFYPSAGRPRWWRLELLSACDLTRQMPAEAKMARKAEMARRARGRAKGGPATAEPAP